MIKQIWLLPPLGYGRLGASPTPCQSFQWGPSDLHPRGTGKTTIRPAETLTVAADGTLTASLPVTVVFKDQAGFRPIAPFFERDHDRARPPPSRAGHSISCLERATSAS